MRISIKKGVVLFFILLFFGLIISPINCCYEIKEGTYELVEVCLPQYVHSSEWYKPVNHTDNIDTAIELVEDNGIILVHCSYNHSYPIKREGTILDKPMTLKGIKAGNTTLRAHASSPYVFSIRSDGISIENLTICDASYPNEPSSICAGIIIHKYADKANQVINIKNNILTNNANGIIINNQIQNNNHCINIINNSVFKNANDGIIINDGAAVLKNNKIHHNVRNGIGIWSENNIIIENNKIYNNARGIWNDHGSCNIIRNNQIYDHKWDGICFFTKYDYLSSNHCCKGNIICNNTIESNNYSGIFLYYSINNKIFNNTFIKNKNSGIKIEYHIFVKDNVFDKATSKNNQIYHNNFIDNGLNEKYNAIDSLDFSTGNIWFNSSLKQGNYWSDYETRYEDSIFLRNGSWSEKYGLPYQLFFNYRFFYFGFYLMLRPKTFDEYPYCRQNGWFKERWPDTPIITPESTTSARIGEPFHFTIFSKDPNNDSIRYGINWSSNKNDSCCDFKNLTVDKWTKYYESGEIATIKDNDIQWDTTGKYFVRVIAQDICNDKNTDGKSKWSKSLNIDVIENT